jgi:hypothetical protein
LIPALHKLRAATGKVLVKVPDGEEYILLIGADGPATIGLGAPIRSVTSHPDGSDKVQAEARLFQEAEKLHKLSRPRRGTQHILSFVVAAPPPATEKLMRDMHLTSKGPLVIADARAQQEIISPETVFANITSSPQRKDYTNGPFGWSDDKFDRCPEPPGGGQHP